MSKKTVLVLGANPINTTHLRLGSEARDIENSLRRANRRDEFAVRTVLATRIQDIRREVLDLSPSIVHFCGHGVGHSGLVLENEEGEPHYVPAQALAEFFRLFAELIDCVVLNACYSELQAQAIASHIKYVVGMSNQISDDAARQFAVAFYDGIGAGRRVSFAFALARSAIRLAGLPQDHIPVLYRYGSLHEPDEVSPWKEERSGEQQKFSDLPPLPSLFFGRKKELTLLKERLGVGTGNRALVPTQVLTAIRGWPGIGKTTLASILAHDHDISTRFKDGIIWITLGPNPRWSTVFLRCGEALGTDEFYAIPSLKDASSRLTSLLRSKNLMLIVDDVWHEDHAALFQQCCGRNCTLLITTRLPRVPQGLSLETEAICNLPPLQEAEALDLLSAITPSVVESSPRECKQLIRDIECLPLAIHVAGRLLRTEEKFGWGIDDLLAALREGGALIHAKAPADQIDLESAEIPTVNALLQKSTDRLDEKMRDYFALLGPLAPRPARFDADVLRAGWQVENPKPVIRCLVDRGLLEPVGNSEFQLHAVLAAHARSLLS